MLFTYKKLDEKETRLEEPLKVIKKNKQEISYFSNKQFNEYRKVLESENRVVSVVRNTKLKLVKERERDKIFTDEYKDKDFLKIDNEYYHLIDERSHKSKGYLSIGDDKFVRIESKLFLLPLLLFFLLLIPLGFFLKDEVQNKPDNNGTTKIPIVNDDGEKLPQTDEDVDDNPDSIKFAGFKTAIVTKKSPYIPLSNNSGTNLGFIYQISERQNVEVVEVFTSYDDAKKFTMNNSKTIENYYNSDDYSVKVDGEITKHYSTYSINTVSDKKYEVIETDYKILYFTGAIMSGSTVQWNAYETLDDTADVHIVVSAYNPEKEKFDTSMSFDATIVVK